MKPIKVTVAGCNTFMCYLKWSVDQEMAELRRANMLLGYRLGNALDRLRGLKQRADTPIGNDVGRAGEGKPTDEPIHPGREVRPLESTAKRDK